MFSSPRSYSRVSASDKDRTGAPSSPLPARRQQSRAWGHRPTLGSPSCAPPAALVSEHLGLAVQGPAASGSGPFAICKYDGADSNPIVVRIQSPAAAGDFAKDKAGSARGGAVVVDVPGVGDEAFSAAVTFLGKTTNSFAARKGDFDVLISAKVPIDKIRSLTTAILAML